MKTIKTIKKHEKSIEINKSDEFWSKSINLTPKQGLGPKPVQKGPKKVQKRVKKHVYKGSP